MSQMSSSSSPDHDGPQVELLDPSIARRTKKASELRPGDSVHMVEKVERVSLVVEGIEILLGNGSTMTLSPDDGVAVL